MRKLAASEYITSSQYYASFCEVVGDYPSVSSDLAMTSRQRNMLHYNEAQKHHLLMSLEAVTVRHSYFAHLLSQQSIC